jgi:hypothetical protein
MVVGTAHASLDNSTSMSFYRIAFFLIMIAFYYLIVLIQFAARKTLTIDTTGSSNFWAQSTVAAEFSHCLGRE